MSALADSIAELRDNEPQWEAFAETSHCAVLAPPGSGKTKLLTTKVADALTSGLIPTPHGAACITMTNEAAMQLRRRLRALGVQRRPNLFIGTVHAFAMSRVLIPFAAAAGETALANSRLCTDAEFDSVFDEAYARTTFAPRERGEIEVTTAKARQRLDLTGNRMLGGQPVADFARLLEEGLQERGLYDFNDAIRHAVRLVETYPWVARVLGSAYPRIYVDEYQDLAPGLDRIVRGITLADAASSVLFAVGDPDQAIFAFSGARPELLLELAQEERVRRVQLEQNYRCTNGIVENSVRILGTHRQFTGTGDGGVVRYHPVRGGESAQTGKAVSLVRAALKEGRSHDSVAILAPWGIDRDACAAALRELSIPVYARSDTLWRTTALTMLIEIMASWAARRDAAGQGLSEILDDLLGLVPASREHSVLKEATGVLLRADAGEPASSFVEGLAAAALGGDPSAPDASDDARELDRMRRALTAGGRAEAMTVSDLGARARAPGHVMASTIHAAKGLEFDHVVLVGADHGGLPGFDPTPDEVAEGRRKFYVSLTRARHVVEIVHTDSRISKKGKSYDVRPSPFISELRLDV